MKFKINIIDIYTGSIVRTLTHLDDVRHLDGQIIFIDNKSEGTGSIYCPKGGELIQIIKEVSDVPNKG